MMRRRMYRHPSSFQPEFALRGHCLVRISPELEYCLGCFQVIPTWATVEGFWPSPYWCYAMQAALEAGPCSDS